VTTVKDARAVGNYSIDHTVAFIYRTNAQSRALEEACVQANLPYVIYGSATSFYKRLEIKDCLCYLRWLANGNDGIAMIRALTTPKRGIGDSTIQEFENYSAELISRRASEGIIATPLDALVSITNDSSQDYPQPRDFLSSRSVKVLTEFARSMKNLRTLAHREPLETVLKFVVDAMGLVPYLDKASKTAAEFEERLQNIRELQQATRRYTVHGPALGTDITPATGGEEGFLESPLSSFLDDVALVTDLADRSAEERFVVNLMTIHASKGKEFDTVFVVGNEDGTFPTSQAIMEGEGSVKLEEEKRLCYVAMTRAKTELFLTWRQLVNVFTTQGIRQENRGRSRFLDVLVGDKGKVTKSDRSDSSLSKSSTEPYSLDSRRKYSTGSALSRSYTSDRRSAGRDLGSSSSSTASRNPPRYGQWKKPGSVVVPPEPSRREGTTSVYGRSSRPMTKPLQERRANTAPIAPLPRRTSSAFVSSSSSSYVSPRPPTSSSPPRRVASSPGRQHRSRDTKIDEWAKPIPVDGNFFYPVGSDVIHKAFGKGVVQPRPPNESDPMMVHVKFLSGRQDRFSARGNDLLPDLLS
jgi:ATP-dependent exoDNAse (exonuclease V) beta subunit